MILVFASYKYGEHLNVIKDSAEDAIKMIEEYCKMEELDEDIDNIGTIIREGLQKQDNVYVPLEDGTWYTITNCDLPIYSVVSSTQDPCEADIVRSYVSLQNAKKALKEAKEGVEEINHEDEDFFVTNDGEVCYQIQKNWIGD